MGLLDSIVAQMEANRPPALQLRHRPVPAAPFKRSVHIFNTTSLAVRHTVRANWYLYVDGRFIEEGWRGIGWIANLRAKLLLWRATGATTKVRLVKYHYRHNKLA
jgi:hypothetical protein